MNKFLRSDFHILLILAMLGAAMTDFPAPLLGNESTTAQLPTGSGK